MTAPVNNTGKAQALIDFCQSGAKLYRSVIPDVGKIVVTKIDSNIDTLPEHQREIAKKAYQACFLAFQTYYAYSAFPSYATGLVAGMICRIAPKFVPIPLNLPKISNTNEMKTEYCLFIAVSSVFFSTMVGSLSSGFVMGNLIPGLLVEDAKPIEKTTEKVEEKPKPVPEEPPLPQTLQERIRGAAGRLLRVPSLPSIPEKLRKLLPFARQ